MDVPDFGDNGLLPPGDYSLTLDELRVSKLVLGPGEPKDHLTWDAAWRLQLVNNAAILIQQLFSIGLNEVFLDGSFVEYKDHPNDIDGYFECDLMKFATGEIHRQLNLLDPHKIWIWDPKSRRPCKGFPKNQLPMWHQYRVELYPHWQGNNSGIKDELGNNLEFPAAFRRRRGDGQPKGIVRIGGI